MQEEIPKKRKTSTSSAVKNRYSKKTYQTYRFMVRFDDPLHEQITQYEGSFSELVRSLLRQFFDTNSKP